MQYIVVDDYDQPISYDSAKYSPAEFGYSGYGDLALQHYFEMNLRYPETAITDKVTGIVYISFVVNSHGDVVRVKLERGVREDIDTESLKAVARMSTWDAARLDGIPVSTKFIIPLSFKFDSEDQHQWRR
jgi:TonB family protein